MDQFAPYYKRYGCFVVRNITTDSNKTIKIFNYPIGFGKTRDLLQIPGVAEADIRASLLKGELRHKILAGDIVVECSDIDLLQFNLSQKAFLQNAGISIGLSADSAGSMIHREDIELDRLSATSFGIPNGESFVVDSLHSIIVYWDGVKQVQGIDYTIASPYTSVTLTFNASVDDIITADYYVSS